MRIHVTDKETASSSKVVERQVTRAAKPVSVFRACGHSYTAVNTSGDRKRTFSLPRARTTQGRRVVVAAATSVPSARAHGNRNAAQDESHCRPLPAIMLSLINLRLHDASSLSRRSTVPASRALLLPRQFNFGVRARARRRFGLRRFVAPRNARRPAN
jgi:hypothetical protein